MIPDEAVRVPTESEQAEIDAFQNGVYGAEPPEWWLNRVASPSQLVSVTCGCCGERVYKLRPYAD